MAHIYYLKLMLRLAFGFQLLLIGGIVMLLLNNSLSTLEPLSVME